VTRTRAAFKAGRDHHTVNVGFIIEMATGIPGEKKRVHRGGSFLCTDQYCSRCMVGTRGKGEVSTGTNHLGFRLVQSVSVAGQ